MTAKESSTPDADASDFSGSEAELDDAINGLRGGVKKDTGDLADFGQANDDIAPSPTGFSNLGDLSDDAASTDADVGGFGRSSIEPHQAPGSALTSNARLIMDIPIDVHIVLGSRRMQVSGLMDLTEGANIALDKKIGEPVEITVNGRRIAWGEITVLENDNTRFGVKLIEVLSATKA